MRRLAARLGALALIVLTVLVIGAGTAHAQETAVLTIDPVGTFDAQTGIATVTGTYSCGDVAGTGLIEVTVQQEVGRVATVTGAGFADVVCQPGATGTWSAEIVPVSGEFRGGRAFASARLLLEGAVLAETGMTIRLSGGGTQPS